jgi:hypothetical protein
MRYGEYHHARSGMAHYCTLQMLLSTVSCMVILHASQQGIYTMSPTKRLDKDLEDLIGGSTEPGAEGTARKYKELGPLHDLLLKACPPDENGVTSIPILARSLGMSAWGVFKWIKADKIPPRQAARISQMSDGRVSLDDFTPYVYR